MIIWQQEEKGLQPGEQLREDPLLEGAPLSGQPQGEVPQDVKVAQPKDVRQQEGSQLLDAVQLDDVVLVALLEKGLQRVERQPEDVHRRGEAKILALPLL